ALPALTTQASRTSQFAITPNWAFTQSIAPLSLSRTDMMLSSLPGSAVRLLFYSDCNRQILRIPEIRLFSILISAASLGSLLVIGKIPGRKSQLAGRSAPDVCKERRICKPHPVKSLQPEATGAVKEAMKWLKPDVAVAVHARLSVAQQASPHPPG